MRGDALRQAFERARNQVGLPELRFHDLRHTAQTLAAAAGASLADLMRRLGHSSAIAAKRYLHASDDRDREITQRLTSLARTTRATAAPRDDLAAHAGGASGAGVYVGDEVRECSGRQYRNHPDERCPTEGST
jgi:hypothetical protein